MRQLGLVFVKAMIALQKCMQKERLHDEQGSRERLDPIQAFRTNFSHKNNLPRANPNNLRTSQQALPLKSSTTSQDCHPVD